MQNRKSTDQKILEKEMLRTFWYQFRIDRYTSGIMTKGEADFLVEEQLRGDTDQADEIIERRKYWVEYQFMEVKKYTRPEAVALVHKRLEDIIISKEEKLRVKISHNNMFYEGSPD